MSSAAPSVSIRPVSKLMAANRSEIAVRIFRAATELGFRTVGIFAQEDRLNIHRYKADEAYQVGQGKGPVAAYLDIESIVSVAKEKGVDAIHPGYGFLSENANFARACEKAGLIFVGPRPELLDMMGDKTAARALAQKINVPTLPGTEEPITDRDEALKVAKSIGFPLIIKAAFGGGGRGMRVVHKAGDLDSLLDEAQGEAERAFGNPAVFLEKYIPRAKHIEVQVQDEQDVERALEPGVRLVLELGHLVHHVQEVAGIGQVVVRIDVRLAHGVPVGEGGERRPLRQQPDDLHVPELGVLDLGRLGIEGREGADGRQQHAHGVRVVAESLHEALDVLVHERVDGDLVDPLVELLPGRQLALDEQIGDLEVRRLLAELLDRIAAVLEDAGRAVDVGDLRPA